MTGTLSIDPGRNCTGWALWNSSGTLEECGLSVLPPGRQKLAEVCEYHWSIISAHLSARRTNGTHLGVLAVVVEQMGLNTGRDSTLPKAIATGNDLLELQAVGAFIAGSVRGSLTYATPGTWKGSATKDATRNRLFGTPLTGPGSLAPVEVEIVKLACRSEKPSLHHNLYDALGIGLWATGRYRIRGASAPLVA